MIKKFIIVFNLLFAFLVAPSKAAFDINARTAILQDFLSGEILYEKEVDSVIYPASMTKIMTSIVVLFISSFTFFAWPIVPFIPFAITHHDEGSLIKFNYISL